MSEQAKKQETNNRQIAKNSLFLYIRTAITMVIALYSSRVILQELGVENYGIYNVVGGVIALLSSLSGTLAGATQRYITFAIGKNDNDYLRKIFSTSLRIHFYLALVILVIAETAGLWFLGNKINLPEGRFFAASIVFQFSLLGFLFNTMTIPFESAVIAKEQFKFYAMIDVTRAILRLSLVLCIGLLPYDPLIVYACIELLMMIFYRGMFIVFTKRNFKGIGYTKEKDKELSSEIMRFTGWNFMGTALSIFYEQGSSILLNIYYGVFLNAAMGVTNQVRGAVSTFISNFTVAVNPQITKSYAQNDYERSNYLMFLGSKIAASLLFIIGFPLILNLDYILDLWLVEVPEYASSFILLSLFALLLATFTIPFNCLMFATGRIKYYQISCVIINVSGILALYLSFEYNLGPLVIFYVLIIQSTLKIIVLLYMARRATLFPVSAYMSKVLLKVIVICLLIASTLYIKQQYLPETDFIMFAIESIVCLVLTFSIVILFVLNSNERNSVFAILKKRIRK